MNHQSYQEIRYGYQSMKQTYEYILNNKEWIFASFLDRNDIVFWDAGLVTGHRYPVLRSCKRS